jgi:hypothetical protein
VEGYPVSGKDGKNRDGAAEKVNPDITHSWKGDRFAKETRRPNRDILESESETALEDNDEGNEREGKAVVQGMTRAYYEQNVASHQK